MHVVHAIQAVFFKFTAPPFLGGLPGSMRIVHPKTSPAPVACHTSLVRWSDTLVCHCHRGGTSRGTCAARLLGPQAQNRLWLACVVMGILTSLGGILYCFALWIFVTMNVPPSPELPHS